MAGRSRAWRYLTGEQDVRRLAATAATAGTGAGVPSPGLGADLRATWRLIRAWLRGEYRDVRLRSVLAVVVAFVYFVSPVDLVPDVFLLLGLTDDLVVVSLLFTVVRQELAGFRLWEQQAFGSVRMPG
jgi:uncharacterized membrane protein YkvA (DUF1232 family)